MTEIVPSVCCPNLISAIANGINNNVMNSSVMNSTNNSLMNGAQNSVMSTRSRIINSVVIVV